jgi:hypothetical protein
MPLKHAFTGTVPDNATAHIKVSYWNQDHRLSGLGEGTVLFHCTTYVTGSCSLFYGGPGSVLGPSTAFTSTWSGTTDQLIISSTTVAAGIHLVSGSATPDVGDSWMTFARSRGTPASPTAALKDDVIGETFYAGYDGAAYQTSARLRVAVDGTVGAAQVPGCVQILTVTSGGVETLALTIDSRQCTTFRGHVRNTAWPTSPNGLPAGEIWSCNGYLRIA